MVRMRITAVLVIGRHDMRAETTHHFDQCPGRLVDRGESERSFRQWRERISLGQSGVDVSEPLLLDAEDLPRGVHLRAPDRREVGMDVGTVPVRVEDRSPLTPGAGDDQDLDTFGYIRSEEHTSELQSRGHLVCRLLLEKKKKNKTGEDATETYGW